MDEISILDTKKILHADLFDIEEVSLQLPDGKRKKHAIIKEHPTVAIFPLTEKYEVYLLSEYRYLFHKRIINAISGYIDAGEAPIHAAKRELREEAGIASGQIEEVLRIDKAASVSTSQSHIFLAKDLTFTTAEPEDDESIELIKMPLEEAVQKILSGQITIASTIIGLLTLDRLRKEKKL
jgi:ADP-ribose pyrophosphatase